MYNTVDVSICTGLWKSAIILEHFHCPKMRNLGSVSTPSPLSLALHPHHPLNYGCKSPQGSYLVFRASVQPSTHKAPKAAAIQRPLGWVSVPRAENRSSRILFTPRSVLGECHNCYSLALACSHSLNSSVFKFVLSHSSPNCKNTNF